MRNITALIILVILALLYVTLAQIVFAEHIRWHNEYVLHPSNVDQLHEIYIIEVWIQSQSDPKCKEGFALTDKGECTSIKFHWDLYPLRILSEMPSFCSTNAVSCVHESGIYILNGHQNTLWHAITNMKLLITSNNG